MKKKITDAKQSARRVAVDNKGDIKRENSVASFLKSCLKDRPDVRLALTGKKKIKIKTRSVRGPRLPALVERGRRQGSAETGRRSEDLSGCSAAKDSSPQGDLLVPL